MPFWDKLASSTNTTDWLQAGLWSVAFIGVAVLVALGKVAPTMLENLLFALVGGLALKERKQNVPPGK